MLADILKSLLLGLIVAVPIGPVLLLVVQKTLSRGRWFGFVAGIGSAVVDTFYAGVGMFALSLIEDFVFAHEDIFLIAGGVLVMGIGIWMALRREDRGVEKQFKGTTAFRYALQAAGCALSNPGALVFVFALMTFFKISPDSITAPVWLLLICIFLGELCWWSCLTYALVHFKRFSRRTIRVISHCAGVCIAVFGLFLFIKGFCI